METHTKRSRLEGAASQACGGRESVIGLQLAPGRVDSHGSARGKCRSAITGQQPETQAWKPSSCTDEDIRMYMKLIASRLEIQRPHACWLVEVDLKGLCAAGAADLQRS
jgi:hypothetical protein